MAYMLSGYNDLVILEEDPLKLESMIQTLVDRSREVDLEINTSKTKVMTNSTPTDITISRQKLEYVEKYEILKSKELSMNIKKKTFDTCILARITYGCETWALMKCYRDKISRCQRTMARSMLVVKLKKNVKSGDTRRKTKLTDILLRVDQLKWRWVTVWYQRDGTRSRGHKTRRPEIDAGPPLVKGSVRQKTVEQAFAVRHTELRDIL
ncbi:endonuclease-reverse transcriptase [Danaus plexippus plexippus]|uniref:Endonuclease-reverse transcriptase n=1 Tax=Danaus plexippus plexippus TaxID=278856 RepID=A0A212F2G3_DANPL|nr:endonuclease-reverse transcriptase [Danaus plexippus plexippus]